MEKTSPNKYEEILNAEGLSCVQLWKSFNMDDEYLNPIKEKMAGYSKDDWETIKLESCEVVYKFLSAYRSDLPYDSPEAMEAAEAQKSLVNKWFHNTTYKHEIWMANAIKLTQLYLYSIDNNTAGFYDKFEPGLMDYVYKAVINNANKRIAM